MSDKIAVGISACLLGEKVRFDGGHKRLTFAVDELAPFVHFEPVCPEMAIGLPSPRPALRLVKAGSDDIRLSFSNQPETDLTSAMQDFSAKKIAGLQHLSGYVVCAKSPSCGMERVRVYEADGKNNRKSGTGIFTQELMRQLPWLPIEEDGRLCDPELKENFVARIYALHEFNQLWQQGMSRARLIAFHSSYKLLLLAHSQPAYRELGRFVAAIDQWPSINECAFEYRNRLMALMSQHSSRRGHTNVLQHVQGYFSNQLSPRQRSELAQLILRYRQGSQPLLAPITLLKHYLAEYPDSYLAQQRYFDPYPEVLRLRYGH
ncbi:YbgA family protein [Yersinia intermedia]|uniref:Purine nucleoside phosphorylase n=1 Tax=Yersinia intermedia TaxID=631 RepID=A0A0T9N4Z2_YERIN|nr:2-thiouracil desulfurase family protein [Yersinia intermedia]CNG77439.1 purine nucleoside phosphorylase [Yersinia intermedia]